MRNLVSVACVLGVSLVIAGCDDDDDDNDNGFVDAAIPDARTVDARPGGGTLDVVLIGESEVPPVGTPASGNLTATIDGDMLTVTGDFADLEADLMEVSGSAAHIHRGDVDEAGPILFNLEVDSDDSRSGTLAGTFELTPEQRMLFQQGLLYVNVHTELNPAGEIRGQLSARQPTVAQVDAIFDAELLPENETEEVDSDASGVATAVLRGNQLTLSGPFIDLTTPLMAVEGSAAHVHEAPPGEAGPIVFNVDVIPDENMMSGRLSITRTLTDDEIAALEAGDYYVNVHTEMYPAGEIRGQLIQR